MTTASRVVAVLGPTNTGKTHYAIERMLAYRTGVMGFPLRLLAREVYDKIVKLRGPSVVALVTGEERIVPPRAQYWICTVEAMPEGMGTDFLAIDEIQLCADPERGHVFTDRLLRARGTRETLFLGADTMRGPISELISGVEFMRRERMSDLLYSGSKKISRMPPRSAIVGFSVDNVYAIAELIRRQKGGAAVVMGALSPRTRNAQVELYQNGEVDYLVATDAIGMGLNLDIDHVAFSSTVKFDGRRMRPLAPNELAQIAGRAGRGMSHGTFGVTGDARPLEEGVATAIMEHRFTPLKKLNWRSADLRFGTIDALIDSLEVGPTDPVLMKAREADDLMALKSLAQDSAMRDRAANAQSVRLLWDVCRIPDFRGISHAEHSSLLSGIYAYLHEGGVVPDDWFARQIRRIDRTDGDIDTLSKRLSFIRTWTYVAQRNGWLRDESHWRGETRAVEDRLSDALHMRLTQRFVDRRTSVLLRRLKQKEALLAEVNDNGEVTVEGEFVGKLEGFRFSPDKTAQGAEAKALKSASLQALAPQYHLRADRFYNAPDTEIDFTDQGGLMWGEHAVGKLVAGADPLSPMVEVFVDDTAGADVAQKVERRLQHFITRKIAALFEPLQNLQNDEALTGLARGFAFRMVESLGVLPRAAVQQEVKDLDQDARGALRKHGIRFGQFTIFMPLLLKPAPTRLRLVLWSLANGLQEFPEAPPPGLVTVPSAKDAPEGYDTMSGYRAAGERMIRIDMLERLADLLRAEDSRGGFEAKPDMLSITGMTLEQFADLMQGLGYRAEKGERVKVKAAPEAAAEAPADAAGDAPAEGEAVEAAAETPAEAPVEAPAETSADVAEAPAAADAEAAEAPAEAAADAPAADADAAEEMEVFFTFTWGRTQRGNSRGPRQGNREGGRQNAQGGNRREAGNREGGKGRGKPGGKPGGKGKGPRKDQGAKTYSARPPKKEKAIDPDNPFAAALMGLKQGD
ncbi:Superfamily II RNA helicase [Tritonibacter multivorans]|uniref:Superfamily II RNA helicase n=1 Tax=Tritonibacter multivorans TaxID=928856 RepID=A0A0P1GCJ0_9RHOB|nr:helicase-related protein [Tritonibacter multivorans]MDA7419286.1 helicase-related protein [Tritonibacter multivorans]CUH79139.1 Superfamily II RNA helicase [Tritonibacter multivorans]SFD23527.1 ATP-dependent RNA helicase SUPV3L1/SUV3 [Tritonibacter multivorans]